MIYRYCPPRRLFWVVFEDLRTKEKWHWWHPFLKYGFVHCWIFQKGKAGTISIQPLRNTWAIDWTPCEPEELATALVADGNYKVLVVERPTAFAYTLRGVITCVSVVKAALNMRTLAITPYQLYLDLLKHGAVEVERSS